MVDKDSRAKLARTMESYLRGDMDSFSLDDVLFEIGGTTGDRTVEEIAHAMWFFYDDTKKHRNSGKHEIPDRHERMIRHWLLLLKSDKEWVGDLTRQNSSGVGGGKLMRFLRGFIAVFDGERPPFADNEYWPLAGNSDWAAVGEQVEQRHKAT